MRSISSSSAPVADASTELAEHRTGMAFQRTRLAADRTLMAVVRTSLSLISFGFTINKGFEQLEAKGMIGDDASGRNFGSSLLLIGLLVLLVGILYQIWFMVALRKQRRVLNAKGWLQSDSPFPPSATLIAALALFCLGAFTAASLIFHVGPFS